MEQRKVAIYSRKSKFTGKGESVENQVQMCRQYIAFQFGQQEAAGACVYEDEGFSGGTLERPQFKKMMQDVQQNRFSAVVVYRLDRISRNIGDFAGLIRQLQQYDVNFISIREQFDTACPMGRAMMYISSVFSQLERETIAERIRDNMLQLAKTGRWLGGTTPTGYTSERIEMTDAVGKTKSAYMLCPIPEELEQVREIYQIYLRTASLTQTEAQLLQLGHQSKTGRQYTRFSIRGILTNPVYLVADANAYAYLQAHGVQLCSAKEEFCGSHGVMAYNRTLQIPGKSQQIRPMEQWICAVGRHQGAIPGRLWVQVQQMLAQNSSKCYRKPRSHVALLSGLLRCGSCGSFMRPKCTQRVNEAGERIYSYICTLKERSKSGCCQMANADGNALDAAVLQAIKQLPITPEELARQLTCHKTIWQSNLADQTRQTDQLQRQLRQKHEQIQNLVQTLARLAPEDAAKNYILDQIDQLHGDVLQLQQILTQMQQEQTDGNLARDMWRRLGSFAAVIDGMSVEQKRQMLRQIVGQVVWDGEKTHVIFVGAAYDYPFPTPQLPHAHADTAVQLPGPL